MSAVSAMPVSNAQTWRRLARGWFGATAFLSIAGLILAVVHAYRDDAGFFRRGWPNAANEFAYFTEQSHLIVAVTCLLLAMNLDHDSTLFRTARLTGVVAIIITGVVYHVLLSSNDHYTGWLWVGNADLHTVVPVMAVLGFVLFGPRGWITPRIVGFTLIFLVVWGVFTAIRGAIIDWYPYGFIDVNAKGYPRVLLNSLGLAIAYVAIGFLCLAIDRALTTARRMNRRRLDSCGAIEILKDRGELFDAVEGVGIENDLNVGDAGGGEIPEALGDLRRRSGDRRISRARRRHSVLEANQDGGGPEQRGGIAANGCARRINLRGQRRQPFRTVLIPDVPTVPEIDVRRGNAQQLLAF